MLGSVLVEIVCSPKVYMLEPWFPVAGLQKVGPRNDWIRTAFIKGFMLVLRLG